MTVPNKTIFLLAAVIITAISAHQLWRHNRSEPRAYPLPVPTTDKAPAPAMGATLVPRPGADAALIPVPLPVPDAASTLAPPDDPVERRRLVNEQARRMYEYAAKAGPDDPFALTAEQIEAFRQRGDPTLW